MAIKLNKAGEYIDYVHTFSGKKFRPLSPDPALIDIRDIAHALAMQARFGGFTETFYSVAEHSFRCSYIVPEADALSALLHDAGEAYLKDLPGPIKHARGMEAYREAEDNVMAAVNIAFQLPSPRPESVTVADHVMVHTEGRDLFPEGSHVTWLDESMALPERIEPMTWDEAERWFLWRFAQLWRK